MESVVGEIRPFAGKFAPGSWLMCDGRELQIQAYQVLFSLIGVTYGGNGYTTFKLPDLRGRLVVGQGTGPSLKPRTIGVGGGGSKVQLRQDQIAIHRHFVTVSGDGGSTDTPSGGAVLAVAPARTDGTIYAYVPGTAAGITKQFLDPTTVGASAGGSQPHDNIMPYQAVSFIICYEGLYPDRP